MGCGVDRDRGQSCDQGRYRVSLLLRQWRGVRGLASKLIDSSKSQGSTIRDQELEVQRLTKALSGTLALVESLAARLKKEGTLKNEALHDIMSHIKGVSGLRRGDIRNMDPKYLVYLRDVLYPKPPRKPPRTRSSSRVTRRKNWLFRPASVSPIFRRWSSARSSGTPRFRQLATGVWRCCRTCSGWSPPD